MKIAVVIGLFNLGVLSSSAFKVAFVGDTGAQLSGSNGYFAKAVYESLTAEGVDLLIQNGDLDYDSDPDQWDGFINTYALSQGMDVLISSGNHEEQIFFGRPWYGSNGYKAKLETRLRNSALLSNSCSGEYGERFACEFGDILVVMIGWKQTSSSSEIAETASYMEEVFRNTDKKFKFCTWHRPEGKVNPGDVHTSNYDSQQLYEICRRNAAMITSGHSHVYGRTKLISSFLPDGSSPGDNPDPQISAVDAFNPTLDCGNTFSTVVGMGGFKFDDDGKYAGRNYFRSKFTGSNSGNRAGALICDIPDNSVGDATLNCEFKLSTGTVIEQFDVTVKSTSFGNQCALSGTPPTPAPTDGCFFFFC